MEESTDDHEVVGEDIVVMEPEVRIDDKDGILGKGGSGSRGGPDNGGDMGRLLSETAKDDDPRDEVDERDVGCLAVTSANLISDSIISARTSMDERIDAERRRPILILVLAALHAEYEIGLFLFVIVRRSRSSSFSSSNLASNACLSSSSIRCKSSCSMSNADLSEASLRC